MLILVKECYIYQSENLNEAKINCNEFWKIAQYKNWSSLKLKRYSKQWENGCLIERSASSK